MRRQKKNLLTIRGEAKPPIQQIELELVLNFETQIRGLKSIRDELYQSIIERLKLGAAVETGIHSLKEPPSTGHLAGHLHPIKMPVQRSAECLARSYMNDFHEFIKHISTCNDPACRAVLYHYETMRAYFNTHAAKDQRRKA